MNVVKKVMAHAIVDATTAVLFHSDVDHERRLNKFARS